MNYQKETNVLNVIHDKEYQHNYYIKNKKYLQYKKRIQYFETMDKCKKYYMEWCKNNKERKKNYAKQYQQEHKEQRNAQLRNRYNTDLTYREKLLEYRRKYRAKNREKIN